VVALLVQHNQNLPTRLFPPVILPNTVTQSYTNPPNEVFSIVRFFLVVACNQSDRLRRRPRVVLKPKLPSLLLMMHLILVDPGISCLLTTMFRIMVPQTFRPVAIIQKPNHQSNPAAICKPPEGTTRRRRPGALCPRRIEWMASSFFMMRSGPKSLQAAK
jgi:hypothetical protein